VKPAVVNITTTQEVKVPRIPLFRDWPFGDFLGGWRGGSSAPDDEAMAKRQALGSGFIVDGRGYVVTNAHVVENANRVRVRLADERELDAKVQGRDERLDLAVLAVDGATDLPTVTLGSGEAVRVGDYVLAIGNPFGLGHTVTMGIVSAKSRAIGAGPYDDFIQTDASINPGNSGGPLFNTRGEVVGVNTAINPNGRGIGFAIPIDALKDVLPQLIERGHVARGRLGVQIQNVDEPMAKALGLDRPRGALVGEVEPGSAGARAGIKPGDVVVAFDGREVGHSQELPRMVARNAPGTKVKVDVLRDRSRRTLEVTLDELKDEPRRSDGKAGPAQAGDPLGLELDDGPEGVVVRRVRPNSPAEGALERGDVILEVGRRAVKSARDVARELGASRTGPVLLRVKRDGSTRFVAIESHS
jgi:serine protease Do